MKVEKVIANVLQLDQSQVTDETSPNNTVEWDSFNGLLLMSEVEKAYNVSFTVEEIATVTNVADIKKLLKKQGIEL